MAAIIYCHYWKWAHQLLLLPMIAATKEHLLLLTKARLRSSIAITGNGHINCSSAANDYCYKGALIAVYKGITAIIHYQYWKWTHGFPSAAYVCCYK